jgi:subtilase family serine protease
MQMSIGRRIRPSLVSVGALALLMSGVAFFSTPAGASTASLVSVPQGLNPTKLPGAVEIGPVPNGCQISVSFVLTAQHQAQLFAYATAAQPAMRFSETEFASTFGQTSTVINGLESYLQSFGITTYAYSNGLDVSAVGTPSQIDQALGIQEEDYSVPSNRGKQTVFASSSDPTLPASIASNILAILGLSDYDSFQSQAVPAARQPAAVANGQVPSGELTPANYESHYNLTPLLNKGDLGQGQTIGIVTLASLDPTVPPVFWKNYLHLSTLANRITLDNVDGGSGPVSLGLGSDETTLDVEQSGAIAPQAKIVVYQAPQTDPGFYDAFNAAASQDVAGSVSTSWGDDETQLLQSINNGTETSAYEAAFDQVFAEMVMQDQAGFVASGDYGAFLSQENGPDSPTDLTVSTLADSPFITSTGGTTLPGTQTYALNENQGGDVPQGGSSPADDNGTESVTIPAEQSWTWSYLWPLWASSPNPQDTSTEAAALDPDNEAGSAGGYSAIEPRPAFQQGVSGVGTFDDREYLTPSDYAEADGLFLPFSFVYTASPSLGTGTGTGRVQPDLSFDADPQTGYAVYDPQFGGDGFLQYGGTSFTAPQLNGVTAVFDSAYGGRVGFWNQFIYRAAESKNSPFTPMDSNTLYGSSYFSETNSEGQSVPITGDFSNDNLYYTGQPGTIFNPATGLGYANLAALYQYELNNGSN